MANSELLFLYDNELQESSFAHHGQSAGSTSLSSYCGSSSSTSKKEKKKRRSSSLKELMNTIQNSISKFRRRSASEKNDKTTCSIITCSSMGNGVSSISSTGAGDLSCTSRICYDDKRFLCDQTPYAINASHKQHLTTPICASLYATPRINKRNAEDSLQSTTKKKLMEKLPQRNLLLPNAPITPFSTTKKSKHPFKQLLSTSATCNSASSRSSSNNNNNIQQPVIVSSSSSSSSSSKASKTTDDNNKVVNLQHTIAITPQTNKNNTNNGPATPSTLTAQSVSGTNQNTILSLQKQLKYDESPSSSLKHKLNDKNESSTHDCRRRLDMPSTMSSSKHHNSMTSASSSSSSSKHHGHGHHHKHREHREHREYREHRDHHINKHRDPNNFNHRNMASQHHHYVNAVPSPNRYSSSNRYINQSDLCTKIISGNYMPVMKNTTTSTSKSSSSSSSSSEKESKSSSQSKCHNHTSACCGLENSKLAAERSTIDNSMRCTLRRGRPNTPKTGLSVDYRIRKSSVPNTPECTHLVSNRVNHTISSDEYNKVVSGEELKKNLHTYMKSSNAAAAAKLNSKSIKLSSNTVVTLSTTSLNTAIIQDDDQTTSRTNLKAENETSLNESTTSRLLDMAFNEDDIEDDLDDDDEEVEDQDSTSSSFYSSATASAVKSSKKLSKSLSLSNLPDCTNQVTNQESSLPNTSSISDNCYPLTKKSLSDMSSNENLLEAISLNDQKQDNKVSPKSEKENESKNVVITENKEQLTEQLTEPEKIEPVFKFKIPENLENDDENMLQNVLRRQSLFKLKEKINGKVSKQISEIERRKLSPYRFSNSPLKQKKSKENSCGSSKPTKRSEIPISKLSEIPEEQYIIKGVQQQQQQLASPFRKLDQNINTNSPQSLVRAAASKFFYKKFGKSRNVKRLNATTQVTGSPCNNSENCANRSLQVSSPAGKRLNTKWKFSNDTIDL